MATRSVTAAINIAKVKAIIQKLIGWLLAICSALIAAVGATQIEEAVDVVMVVFFTVLTALGVLLIIKGSKKSRLIKLYHAYSAGLTADSDNSIEALAASAGVSVAAATKHIRGMIALGFFPDSFLDGQRNRLIMPGISEQGVRYTVVQCKSCGGANRIIAGASGTCEFCGLPISGRL